MRIIISLLSFFLILACKPKKTTTTPPPSVPSAKEEIGIYKNATVYAGKTDYEFEVNGQSILIEVSNIDAVNQPTIPSNLTESNVDGLSGPNPLLIGSKYKLEYGSNGKMKSISLAELPNASNVNLPAIPENYSGLLPLGLSEDSRAYLNLAADLSAMLLIVYEQNQAPSVKYGRWVRSEDGTQLNAQFEEEIWSFLVKKNGLVLLSNQMGTGGLTLVSTETFHICDYVRLWLSNLSNIDGNNKILVENINNETPLAQILRTEHAYAGLYGDLAITFGVSEDRTNEGLRKNPTVQGVCDLVMHLGFN